MSAIETAEVHTYALSGRDTAKILSRALAERVPMTLRTEASGRTVVCGGPLQDARANVLVIGLDKVDAENLGRMIEGMLLATFELDGVAYAFDTHGVGDASVGKSATVQVETPKSMAATDRRRAPRRRLTKTTEVVLHAPETDPGWRCKGVLLNVSSDGLACRVSGEVDLSLRRGRNVRVVFRLTPSSSPFDLGARIANVTQSAEPEQFIVGLEFLSSAAAAPERGRLRTAVEAAAARNG
jgi:hypothetical protein